MTDELLDLEVKFLFPDKAKALYQPGWYVLNEGEIIDGPYPTEQGALDEVERLEEEWI